MELKPLDQSNAGEWHSSCGRITINMSEDMWYDCSQGGVDAEPFLDAYLEDSDHYRINGKAKHVIEYLLELGAWELSELKADPEMTMKRLLWIAACDIKEETIR